MFPSKDVRFLYSVSQLQIEYTHQTWPAFGMLSDLYPRIGENGMQL
jgi:hypothetical protein